MKDLTKEDILTDKETADQLNQMDQKGSGGGSSILNSRKNSRKNFKVCISLFMRYYCGEKDIYTEDDLECGMKYTDAPGVKLEDIS